MKRLLLCTTLLFCSIAQADINSAMALAEQAGAIAGAASACGQDVSPLASRLQEAFNIMVTDENEKAKTMMTYLQAYNSAKEMEQAKAKIPCDQVIKDYNSLPILKPDYQQTVLPGLRDTTPSASSQPAPQPAPAPSVAAPTQPNIPALAAPGTAPTNPPALPQPTVPANNTVQPGALPAQPTVPAPR